MLELKLPDAKKLFGKDPDARKDWQQEEKGITEDEMVEWYHRLSGHEFGWTSGVGDGQAGLACCDSWGHKESDTTERLNWTDGFSSSHVLMWELDYKESWALKNWCFWTVVLEKTLESPLDCKKIQPVNPKGNQSWIFTGGTEAEAPILWLLDAKSWFLRKDSDAGKDWWQEEKGMTEDEMVEWHHQLNGHEFGKLRQLLIDREAWHAAVHGVHWVAKSQTWLSNWTDLTQVSTWFVD